MERYNVGPHRRHAVWMMAGHKIITDHDYKGMITQAEVRPCVCAVAVVYS